MLSDQKPDPYREVRRKPGPNASGAELALELNETPDLGAVGADAGFDLGGGLADGGQVDTE
jgi:hypothetical protein